MKILDPGRVAAPLAQLQHPGWESLLNTVRQNKGVYIYLAESYSQNVGVFDSYS